MIADLRRHQLLRVHPSCWPRVLARAPAAAAGAMEATLMQWAERGWPVMVRRYLPEEAHDAIPVAVSLPSLPPPPQQQRRRAGLSLRVLDEELAGAVAALPLAAALAHAPASWRPTMQTLAAIGKQCGSEPLLYGSLLWQILTQMTYLTARSDLDVCWPVDSEQQAQCLVHELARLQRQSPLRIDGELLLPDGGGLSWREFADRSVAGAELLVKTLHAVSSRARAALFVQAAPA